MIRLQEIQELNLLLEQENHALKKKNQVVETKNAALGEERISLKKENEEIFGKLNEVKGLEHKNQQLQFHIQQMIQQKNRLEAALVKAHQEVNKQKSTIPNLNTM